MVSMRLCPYPRGKTAWPAILIILCSGVMLLTGGRAGAGEEQPPEVYTTNLPAILDLTRFPLNGDFEAGPGAGWTEESSSGLQLVTDDFADATLAPHAGDWAAWLGGGLNELSVLSQQVTVHPSRPFLTFYHLIASEDECDIDHSVVFVDSTVVQGYDLCADTATEGWELQTIDLSAYAGQSVALSFLAETDDKLESNWLLDDVAFAAGPVAGR